MLATVRSCYTNGIEGHLILVEVDVSPGLPAFYICGLPDTAVKEAKDRVRAAIKNSGFEFPLQRITVNLAPADLKKVGSQFDLAIAIGILAATGQVPMESLKGLYALGELSLTGTLRKTHGVLPMAQKIQEVEPGALMVLPEENNLEASLARQIKVVSPNDLHVLVRHLKGEESIAVCSVDPLEYLCPQEPVHELDMSQVNGQQNAKRALEIAAAGGHNILMMGPPGSGKTMLAKRVPGILPPMELEEALTVTKVFSVAGLTKPETPLITTRPFQAPHHTSSTASIIGGGQIPRPGEISLATHGILFLDELPEFRRDVIEALRQPLEEKRITIARASGTVTYPAAFHLISAMNPCPCGFLDDEQKECRCSPVQVKKYRSRVSGPILDRIDLHIQVPRLSYGEFTKSGNAEASARIRERVVSCRHLQAERLLPEGIKQNSDLHGELVKKYCVLTRAGRNFLARIFDRLHLSMRSYSKMLKVARTIADLEGEEIISQDHLAEAAQMRWANW